MREIVLGVVLLVLAGCANMEIKQIADSISDIANGNVPSNIDSYSTGSSNAPVGSGYKHQGQQYAVESEVFSITAPTRMNKDLGAIRAVRHENNPKGMTMVRILGYHQDSGADLESYTWLYKIAENDWLKKDAVTSYRSEAFVINSGRYYLKSESNTGGFHTTGEIDIQRGVTNIVSVELE